MIKKIMAMPFIGIAIAVVQPAFGQQQQEGTLAYLWSRVEKNYSGIVSRNAAIEAADLSERATRNNALPQIKAQAQNTYGTFNGSPGAFFPQAGFFNVSGLSAEIQGSNIAANAFGSATIDWEIYSFGRLKMENEAAHAITGKRTSERDAYLLSLKRILAERYITLLYTEAKLRWNQTSIQRLEDIRKITTALSLSGLRPAADSLLALSSYTQAAGNNDLLIGDRKAAMRKVSELSGNETIYFESSLDRFSGVRQFESFSDSSVLQLSHPALEALRKETEYYFASSDAQKRLAMPSVRLLAGYGYRASGISGNGTVSARWVDGFTNGTGNVLAGLGVAWNITSLYTSKIKGEALQRDAKSIQFRQVELEESMRSSLDSYQTRIRQQFQQLKKSQDAVSQARLAYQMYRARYSSGLMTLSDLLVIQSLLEKAEEGFIEASRGYWTLLSYQAEIKADFEFLFSNL